jgi:outer membrane protein OmpA-like peptidoglycan-associated protein
MLPTVIFAHSKTIDIMKKLLLTLFVIGGFSAAFAQNKDLKKQPSIGFQFSLFDFTTGIELQNKGLASVLRDKSYKKRERLNPGFTLHYMQGITNNIDVMARLSGSFFAYPTRTVAPGFSDKFYLETDVNLNVKLLPDSYVVVPYLQAGIGAAKERGNFMAYMPLGVGLQFSFFDQAFFHLNSGYRVPVTSKANYGLVHSFGFSVPLKDRKVTPPPPPPAPEPPKDKDGDGVLDADDACPDVAGVAALRGCPDADKDGIADKDDKCPQQAGVARYNGCPIPDSDKDGINDEEDKCPQQAGVARYNGCPVPDSDKDGVNDEEDKCPSVAGIAANAGCPEVKEEIKTKVEFAARNIFFTTGNYQLSKKSYAPLNEVAKILKDNPTLQLDVEGHTDNTGDAAKNQTLSENRAAAVKAYLVAQGVEGSRLTSAGYGQDRPVADNKTAAGKAQNRRVELKLRSY